MHRNISIIIPFHNERSNVHFVMDEIHDLYPHAEIIAVDDGSTDGTGDQLKTLPYIKLVSLDSKNGQGVAVFRGLEAATKDICALLDGDGQNDPRDIERLLKMLAKTDCVWGYRKNRADSFSRILSSKIANRVRNVFFGKDGVRDVGCSLRVFHRSSIKHLVPFEGLHRFMPVFFKAAGLSIVEVQVNHRPRFSGKTKYSISRRALRGLRDVIRVNRMLSK